PARSTRVAPQADRAPSVAGSAPRLGEGRCGMSEETPRSRFRREWAADRKANAGYPKSRFVLRWFRSAQRWRRSRGPLARLIFVVVGGSYKVFTEGFMGIELPVSTEVAAGLRLRHGVGVVVNPASRIGARVMIRQGVTLGNRKTATDCPVIEDDVEIGVGAVIIGDVTIGRGARIGPNAVVFRDVPAGATVASPASEVRQRHSDPVGKPLDARQGNVL